MLGPADELREPRASRVCITTHPEPEKFCTVQEIIGLETHRARNFLADRSELLPSVSVQSAARRRGCDTQRTHTGHCAKARPSTLRRAERAEARDAGARAASRETIREIRRRRPHEIGKDVYTCTQDDQPTYTSHVSYSTAIGLCDCMYRAKLLGAGRWYVTTVYMCRRAHAAPGSCQGAFGQLK